MSWPPQIDPTHAMNQPAKRARKKTPPMYLAPGEVVPDPHGTREEREAWMRAKQAGKIRPCRTQKPERHPNSLISQLAIQFEQRYRAMKAQPGAQAPERKAPNDCTDSHSPGVRPGNDPDPRLTNGASADNNRQAGEIRPAPTANDLIWWVD